MDDPIERVAFAIWRASFANEPPRRWEDVTPTIRESFRRMAWAALHAFFHQTVFVTVAEAEPPMHRVFQARSVAGALGGRRWQTEWSLGTTFVEALVNTIREGEGHLV